MIEIRKFPTRLFAIFLTLGTTCAAWAQETQPETSAQSPEAVDSDTQPNSTSSESSTSKTTRTLTRTRPKSKIEEYGTSFIFSADLGLLSALPSTKVKDYGPKFGLAVEGKALGSILLNDYIIDAGFGWFFYNISGAEPLRNESGDVLVTDDDVAITDTTGIKLSGSVLEVAPSYRLKNNVFAGPVFQLRYPSDLSYDSTVARKKTGILVGGQGGYQIFDEDLNTRFVGRMMTTLNDTNWLGIYLMAGVQVGLPFTQPEILTIQETTTKTSEKRIVEYRKQEYKFKVTRDIVKLVLDNLVVFFPDPGYPTLTTESQSFLIDLAQSLSTTEKEWGTLRIDTVSKDHGQVIRDALVSAGISDKKVAFGQVVSGPKVSNPPVEFSFTNVKNSSKLIDSVRQAMKAIDIPETCEGGVCK